MIPIKQIIAGGNVQLLLTAPNQFRNIRCCDGAFCDTAAQRDFVKCHLYLLNRRVLFPPTFPFYLFPLYPFRFLLIAFIMFFSEHSKKTAKPQCLQRALNHVPVYTTQLLLYFRGRQNVKHSEREKNCKKSIITT